ncbi:MAG: TonB-dependent receptor [Balneolaceae bacterium]|nr:TonB-dependent receptor [Balneolaceae bacterium]MCH8549961.1 TonB-dependent receptor [Balneolaceae bacterium]
MAKWLTIASIWILMLGVTDPANATENDRDRGTVYGIVTDSETGDPLAGATIMIKGTSIGTATDVEGRFRLRRVPSGDQIIVTNYIGYDQAEFSVTIRGGDEVRADFSLSMATLQMEGLSVVAQAVGQAGAFNKQRNAPNIVQVASDEQIQRFPDLNVSDALRRMPGISTEEFRGEATAMFVRGMAPGLNTVTLDGERLPTTGTTDRDVGLTGISSDLVGAIEVTKAITPDMDADAVGGSVNLVANRPVGDQRVFNVTASGGWHNHAGIGNPKASVHFGQSRGNLSYIVRGNISRENRQMDDIRHFWGEQEFNGQTIDNITQMRIGDYAFQTDRYALSGRVDYRLNNNHSLFVRGLYNLRDKTGTRHQFRLRPDRGDVVALNGTQYQVEGARVEPIGRRNAIRNVLSSLTLGGESEFSNLTMNYTATYAYGTHDSPYQEYLRYRANGLDMTYDIANRSAAEIGWMNGAGNVVADPSSYRMTRYENRIDDMTDQDFNTRVNFRMPFNLGRAAGNFQFGGRFFHKQKEREQSVMEFNDIDGTFLMSEVASSGFNRQLVSGRYDIFHTVDWDRGRPFRTANMDRFRMDSDDELEFHLVSDPADYTATETITAGYMMSTIEQGNWMILAGVRAENTGTTYRGNRTIIDENEQFAGRQQMSESNTYLNFFPMAHVRYNLTDRSNIRFAWTNSIARPSFTNLAPFEIANFESESVRRGNPDLKASRVMNLDLMYENYFRSIGVLSAGLFYKSLDDFVFEEVSTEEGGVFDGFESRRPQNGTTAEVFGAEIAWQQRLHFLPGYLSGLGVYTNYTYSTSKAQLRIDREVELPRQIPHVVNAALTFERGGFYSMLSYNYQSTYLYQVSTTQVSNHRSHLFPSNDRYMRWQERVDLTLRYQASPSIQIFADARNLTNSPQTWYDGSSDYHYRSSFNHVNGTLGIRFTR